MTYPAPDLGKDRISELTEEMDRLYMEIGERLYYKDSGDCSHLVNRVESIRRELMRLSSGRKVLDANMSRIEELKTDEEKTIPEREAFRAMFIEPDLSENEGR